MTFVKTVQTPVTAKIKTDSGSGFSEMLDSGYKNKCRILLESTPDPWPPMLGSIPHKQSAKLGATIHWKNILEMLIISLFIWKRFCLPGNLTLMLTVVRRISKPKWMPLDMYRPSTLISCISWRSSDVIPKFGVRPSLTSSFTTIDGVINVVITREVGKGELYTRPAIRSYNPQYFAVIAHNLEQNCGFGSALPP